VGSTEVPFLELNLNWLISYVMFIKLILPYMHNCFPLKICSIAYKVFSILWFTKLNY
jgi:hypothetical protein